MLNIIGKRIVSVLLISSLYLLNLPELSAQDVITSDEFSGGASLFTFKENRKSKKKFIAVKKGFVPRRNAQQQKKQRQNLKSQISTLAVNKPNRERAKKVDPKNLPKTTPKTPAAKAKASQDYAGAGETYLDENNSVGAIDAFRKSLALNPKNNAAKLGLSDALTRKGNESAEQDDLPQAQASYQEAVKNDPSNSVALAGLGNVYESQNNGSPAITNYEKALALNDELSEVFAPLGILYYEKGEIAKAENYLQKADAAHPGNAETKLYLGLVGLKQNQNDKALQELNHSLKINPNYPQAYYYRGAIYNRQNKGDEAVSDYQKAIFIDSNYTDAIFDLGTTQYNQEKFNESAVSYEKVVALESANGDAHANLAETYRQLEQYPKANEKYLTAAEYVKDDPELYSSWGYCLGKENKWDKAAVRLETAKDMRGDATDYANVGWAYNRAAEEDFKAERPADAAAKLTASKEASKKATELDQNLASGFLNLGTALNGLKDYENASNALQRTVQLRDDWYFAHHELGKALRGWGKVAEAINAFQRVVSLNNQFAVGFFNLGEAQFAIGDKKGAEKTLKQLKKLNPALASSLDNVLKGKIDQQKQKVEQKVKDKTINKIPKLPY